MNTLALKWAQMNQRDRRAVILLTPVVAVILLLRFVVFPVMDVMDDASRAIPVREKVLHHTHDELPFSTAVVVDQYDEPDRPGGFLDR